MLSLYFSLLLPRPAPANPSPSPFARDAFVRVEGVGAGRRSLVLAEQERVVHLLLTGRDTVLDCTAVRRRPALLEGLLQEVEAAEESGVWPAGVDWAELSIDLGWYGRRGRKAVRDGARDWETADPTQSSELAQELADRHWSSSPVSGTNT